MYMSRIISNHIQSPLNYTGGKYKLLPQILPLFPQDINSFVDVFCGGGNVGVNINCQQVIFNDIDKNVIGLLKLFKNVPINKLICDIMNIINEYGLSLVFEHGYEYYNCNSSAGLGNYNKQSFFKLREYFNALKRKDKKYYTYLYVLIIYAFNNQIRFNSKGEYNLPVGKRDFNGDMQTKLKKFVARLQEKQCSFISRDFRYFSSQRLTPQDFLYADPPYLITCATYNEKEGWNTQKEKCLYKYLDSLNEHHIRFALSNVLSSKGKTNEILKAWLNEHVGVYACHHLDYNYSNSNYHTIDRSTGSDEVLVTNY